MKKYLLFVFAFCFLLGCSNKENKVKNIERAFYYWKSGSSFSTETSSQLNKLEVKKIYYKLFEVDYSETMGNFPYQKNNPDQYTFRDLDSVNVVPTIFIKNEIFQYNNEKSLDKLADNIVFLINKYRKERYRYGNNEEINFDYSEIQIDCDWTKSTKDKYFYLLKKIKELSKKEISCTLRLYPYKYPDIMGVPPVDKAMLMCYNLIKPLSQSDKNSILDINELKSYLDKKRSYPVHLDIALPVFYWTLWYHNNRFAGLVDFSSADISGITKQTKPMWYEMTEDYTFEYEYYLKKGDQLKIEEVDTKTLQEAISIIKKNVELDDTTTISLFHLGNSTLKKYKNEEISSFYSAFSK
ncbi:hypothetical protein [Flavobacterium foetidum]|uniref:hypothetical protein n=1 Tax=Flavobacterium foetidum TaxID=2026681 RepID=UPI001074ACC6|nr:hypothetical protein [Flavobacterium foetidum]KAF2516481.1 hypothetical protein E0W73_05155 [Flavobacterium foetidum]